MPEPSMLRALLKPEVQELIEARAWTQLREFLAEWPEPEIAELLLDLAKPDRVLLFRTLPRTLAAEVFAHLQPEDQDALLHDLTDEETRHLLANLTPDDRTHLLEELPGQVTNRLLNLLGPEEVREARQLLGYPEGSVGRLMTPNYVVVRSGWTVRRALDHIRRYGKDSETINRIYVTDQRGVLIDDISLRRFILADPDDTVEDLMDHSFISVSAFDDGEHAVRLIQRYDLVALPVVDSEGVLLGIVTVDDLLDVAQEEATEDFQRIGGMAPVEIDYGRAGIGLLWRKRIGWLLVLLVADFMSSSVIAFYEEAIQAVVALSFFIPMLIDSGGNTGTQSATLIIRGLATGQLQIRDWLRVLLKEIGVGLLLGLTLGIIVYLRGYFWRGGPEVGLVVGLTMVALVVWANLIGAVLPIVLSKLRLDPAVVSSPFITTACDVTGLLIYFNVAKWVLDI